VELKDEKDGWKLVDENSDVLLWSSEQTMILVEDGMIKTLHGSIKFNHLIDFQEFKNRREATKAGTQDNVPEQEDDYGDVDEEKGELVLSRHFSFQKMANTSKSFKILASLVPDKDEVVVEQEKDFLYEVTFPSDKRRKTFKKKN
jgi:hypothetical protein